MKILILNSRPSRCSPMWSLAMDVSPKGSVHGTANKWEMNSKLLLQALVEGRLLSCGLGVCSILGRWGWVSSTFFASCGSSDPPHFSPLSSQSPEDRSIPCRSPPSPQKVPRGHPDHPGVLESPVANSATLTNI